MSSQLFYTPFHEEQLLLRVQEQPSCVAALAEDITDEDVTSSHALPVLVFISVCGYLFLSLV